jgi:uncharacterized protein (TIGR03083 family)
MNNDATHDEVRETLAAWALDACADYEVARVEEHLEDCDACAEEARVLRGAAGWLAVAQTAEPPAALRDSVLAAAFAARTPGQPRQSPPAPAAPGPEPSADPFGDATDEVGAYGTEVAKLDRLLTTLLPAHWDTPTAEGWTVVELVAHLWAIDGVLAAGIVADEPGSLGDPADAGVDDRTTRAQDHARAVGAEQLRRRWRARADLLVATARTEPALLAGNVAFLGVDLPVATVFADRSFETWLHAEDIRAAVGSPSVPLEAEEIRLVATSAVSLLPLALGLTGAPARDGRVELVLNGPGGGVWQVPLGGPGGDGPAAATIEADVMEFCLLFGGRYQPDTVPCTIRGDTAAASSVLVAAASLARP